MINALIGNITLLDVDAIVNAANNSLLGGGGVDGAIHRAAGPMLLTECTSLNGCETGNAKITSGYNLKARHIIHTVGPVWTGGKKNETELLNMCYVNSLKIAYDNNFKTIAFPCISTGAYCFPKDIAAEIAVKAVENYILKNNFKIDVTFCCFFEDDYLLYKNLLNKGKV